MKWCFSHSLWSLCFSWWWIVTALLTLCCLCRTKVVLQDEFDRNLLRMKFSAGEWRELGLLMWCDAPWDRVWTITPKAISPPTWKQLSKHRWSHLLEAQKPLLKPGRQTGSGGDWGCWCGKKQPMTLSRCLRLSKGQKSKCQRKQPWADCLCLLAGSGGGGGVPKDKEDHSIPPQASSAPIGQREILLFWPLTAEEASSRRGGGGTTNRTKYVDVCA